MTFFSSVLNCFIKKLPYYLDLTEYRHSYQKRTGNIGVTLTGGFNGEEKVEEEDEEEDDDDGDDNRVNVIFVSNQK